MSSRPAHKSGELIADSVLSLIGNTPLVRLHRLPQPGSAEILAKLEFMSPGGSIKDRLALNLIGKAEELGLIHPGSVIIEPTSGNTGIGLAMVCAAKKYRCLITMPDSMSMERIVVLRRFGAEVVLTPAKAGMTGAVEKAHELAKKTPGAFLPLQFESQWNAEIHRRTTATEILAATDGRLDAFVASVGTGGTLTGVGEVLKAAAPKARVVAVEPKASPVLSGGPAGQHKIQGIGAGFVPKVLRREVIDQIVCVSDEQAFETMKDLAASEGILAGLSAGAAVFAACQIALELGPSQRVVVIVPDTGERYISVQHYFEF